MKMPITKLALVLVLTIFMTGLIGGEALAQNAQWNSLFDRIIRLEANVKNMARGGGSSWRLSTNAKQRANAPTTQ